MHSKAISLTCLLSLLSTLAGPLSWQSASGAQSLSIEEALLLAQRMLDVRQEMWAAEAVIEVDEPQSGFAPKQKYEYAVNFARDHVKLFQVLPGRTEFKYIRNTGESLLMIGTAQKITKNVPSRVHEHPSLCPFDVRTAGLQTKGEYDYRWTLDQMRECYLTNIKLVAAEQIDSDSVKLTWEYSAAPLGWARRTILVDTAHGLTPIEMSFDICIGATTESDTNEFVRRERTLTSWQEIDGIWVPQESSFEDSNGQVVLTCNYIWTSINQELSEDVFSIDGMNPKPGTYIVNTRPSKPIIEDVIDDPIKRHLSGVSNSSGIATAGSRWTRIAIIIPNLIVICLLVFAVWRRARSKSVV